jgi:hypothetical protein
MFFMIFSIFYAFQKYRSFCQENNINSYQIVINSTHLKFSYSAFYDCKQPGQPVKTAL